MTTLAHIGGAVAGIGLGVLVAGSGRLLRLAGLASVALGVLCLAAYLAPAGHHVAYVGAGVAGAVAAVAGAVALRRWPWILAFATLLLVPVRVPITVGATEANLLVPLYLVVASAAMLLAWELAAGDRRSRELGLATLPLAGLVAWTGLSLSWTLDLKRGAIELLFFYFPFGLLALAFARLPWRPRLVPWLYVQLAAMALLFAFVGLYQEAAHDVFWNPKVIVGNAYESFFRVNSLFWDPSIYGRFLVVAILAGLVVVLLGPGGRVRVAAAAAIGVSWAGLFFSFSQSSFAALIVGVIIAAAVAFRPRQATVTTAAAVVIALVAVWPSRAPASAVVPPVAQEVGSRGKLVSEGIHVALDHPLAGVGIGGFNRAYADRVGLKGAGLKRAASHTTPVTVAAETGIVGLALLVWLAVTALVMPFSRAGPSLTGRASLAFGLTLVAIGVHSLGYNALFEDPMAWSVLGLAACAALARPEEQRT